jgi:hypothetical protein
VLWTLQSDTEAQAKRAGVDKELVSYGVRKPSRSFESMFGVTASFAYSFTSADVVTAHNVSYLGVQLGIYAKP